MEYIWILVSHLILVADKTDLWMKYSVRMANTWHPWYPLHSCTLGMYGSPIPELTPAEHPFPLGLLNSVLQAAATNESVGVQVKHLVPALEEWKEPIFSETPKFKYHICSLSLTRPWFFSLFMFVSWYQLAGLLGKLQIMYVGYLTQCLLQLEFHK